MHVFSDLFAPEPDALAAIAFHRNNGRDKNFSVTTMNPL